MDRPCFKLGVALVDPEARADEESNINGLDSARYLPIGRWQGFGFRAG